MLGRPGNFWAAQRHIESYGRLLLRSKKFSRTQLRPSLFSSHLKKLFSLVPQLPPGDPTVLWKIQAGNQAWGCWGQVVVFPSLSLFSGGGFCLFFFFFPFKRGVPATKGSFFYRAIPSLSLTFFLFAPSFLSNSESLDATNLNPARSTNPAPESFHPNLAQPDSKEILPLSLQLSRSLSLDPFMPSRQR